MRRRMSLRRLSRRPLLLSSFGSAGAVLHVLLYSDLRRLVRLCLGQSGRLSRWPLLLSSFASAGAVLRVLLLSDLGRHVRCLGLSLM